MCKSNLALGTGFLLLAVLWVDPRRRSPVPFCQVVLLQNMVGPGEVDDELEAETKEVWPRGKVVCSVA